LSASLASCGSGAVSRASRRNSARRYRPESLKARAPTRCQSDFRRQYRCLSGVKQAGSSSPEGQRFKFSPHNRIQCKNPGLSAGVFLLGITGQASFHVPPAGIGRRLVADPAGFPDREVIGLYCRDVISQRMQPLRRGAWSLPLLTSTSFGCASIKRMSQTKVRRSIVRSNDAIWIHNLSTTRNRAPIGFAYVRPRHSSAHLE